MWAALFVETVLSNPEKTPAECTKLAIDIFSKDPDKMDEFIGKLSTSYKKIKFVKHTLKNPIPDFQKIMNDHFRQGYYLLPVT